MTPELTVLALAALLQLVQFILYSITGNQQAGVEAGLGPRDKKHEMTGTAGRLQRALNNHFEGLIMFTIAVVVVTLGNQSTGVTQAAAWVYLAARVLYVPAYVFGWIPWRSVIWMIGLAATMTMIIAALI